MYLATYLVYLVFSDFQRLCLKYDLKNGNAFSSNVIHIPAEKKKKNT